MLKILLKKQLMEVFKSYFYDAKKNKKRSTLSMIGFFILFAVIIVGVLGAIFFMMASNLCKPLVSINLSWLYFTLISFVAILLGAFGSVFNTFAGLYLAKDNDLLLSMPIPVKDIVASRLINVYLLGTMYSAIVFIPGMIVYLLTCADLEIEYGIAGVLGGILQLINITLIVLILSCLLGWCVAKISVKLKHRSFATVFISIFFIGIYYFFYFKAQSILMSLILNAEIVGEKIKGSAYIIYQFGRVACGDAVAIIVCLGLTLAALAGTWLILKSTFLSIATTTGSSAKVKYKAKAVKEKSIFGALLSKELARFTSSPTYMLNCGLGILFIPVMGIAALFKGQMVYELFEVVFGADTGLPIILLVTSLLTISSMNDMAAPALSLEGNNLWIAQSLPIEPKLVIRAKTSMHLMLTGIPMAFTLLCITLIIPVSFAEKILMILTVLSHLFFYASFASFLGTRMPNLSWTNELAPIKQSACVFLSMFGSILITIAFCGIYFVAAHTLGSILYMIIWIIVFILLGTLLWIWLDTRGAKKFTELG